MVHAIYLDGRSSRQLPITMVAAGGRLRMQGEGLNRVVPLAALEVSPRLGHTRRILHLPDGAEIHCDDNDAIDDMFPLHNRLQRWVHIMEQCWRVALAALVLSVATGFAFFRWGLPALADGVAQRLPWEVDQVLGTQVEPMLDRLGFSASAVDEETRTALLARFDALREGLVFADSYRLEFRDWRGEANAVALPGGLVIVTDGLVKLLDEDEVVAVMAHELGHQEHRHVLRMVMQGTSVALIASMALGDVSGLAVLGAGVPVFLMNNHYSRDFEREADAFAFDLLRRHGHSPQAFASAMRKIKSRYGDDPRALAYLSSHPATDDRIAAAEKAADE
ncbi:MAG TPA: M48 family metallopeptidase [Xanthomonadaceae bacterium]|nr:M48 family metallopeptidase [Xanthomonadaceae bacterium]